MRLFLFLLFICPSAFAAYTEMVIEGVQQSNGVWTTAGVMDTQGFVRTTGAVTVSGVTRNLPVTLAADTGLASTMFKGATRLAGPVALAATAYEVYSWYKSYSLDGVGGEWYYIDPTTVFDPALTDGKVSCTYLFGIANSTVAACVDGWKRQYPTKQLSGGITLNSYYSPNPSCSTSGCKYFYAQNSTPSGSPLWFEIMWPLNMSYPPHNKPRPATDADFMNMPAAPIPLMSSNWSKFPSLGGTPINSTEFTPFSEWYGEPYFKDGNWWRDRMDISPSPAPGQPTRVRIDVGPIKLEGMTDPNIKPDDTPASSSTQPKEQTKFCDDNPHSIACIELGELEDEKITPDERPFHITPESPWGQDNASCPSPEIETLRTGSMVTFSYQPTCDFFSSIRPAVIAVAFLAALYIALGIPAGKGD